MVVVVGTLYLPSISINILLFSILLLRVRDRLSSLKADKKVSRHSLCVCERKRAEKAHGAHHFLTGAHLFFFLPTHLHFYAVNERIVVKTSKRKDSADSFKLAKPKKKRGVTISQVGKSLLIFTCQTLYFITENRNYKLSSQIIN